MIAVRSHADVVESVNKMAKEWAKSFYNSKLWKDTAESVKADNNYLCSKCRRKTSWNSASCYMAHTKKY